MKDCDRARQIEGIVTDLLDMTLFDNVNVSTASNGIKITIEAHMGGKMSSIYRIIGYREITHCQRELTSSVHAHLTDLVTNTFISLTMKKEHDHGRHANQVS